MLGYFLFRFGVEDVFYLETVITYFAFAVNLLPLFMTKKEVFVWLKDGTKTIDVRKGKPSRGETATFMSGPNLLRLPIVKKETGKLAEIIRPDNFKSVIPTAKTHIDALNYLQTLYQTSEGTFTAYHVSQAV